jgi:ribonuclease-3
MTPPKKSKSTSDATASNSVSKQYPSSGESESEREDNFVTEIDQSPASDVAGRDAHHSLSPFNPKNVLLEKDDIERIFRRYGVDIPIHDVNWYRKALTHRSYCTRKNENFLQGNTSRPEGCLPLQEDSNECLEFLGDAVLGAVVGSYLKERYPDENEGFLTRMRTKLVNGNMLSEMCKMAGLQSFIIISRQIEDNNGRKSKNILEDCFEAFIGAIFEDAERDMQFNRARDWLEAFIEEHIDFTDLITQHNSHKDLLCKYFQHAFHCMPRFHEVDPQASSSMSENSNNTTDAMMIDCNAGKSQFTVCVKNKDNVVVGKGTSNTKKGAENAAARKALVYFGQLR